MPCVCLVASYAEQCCAVSALHRDIHSHGWSSSLQLCSAHGIELAHRTFIEQRRFDEWQHVGGSGNLHFHARCDGFERMCELPALHARGGLPACHHHHSHSVTQWYCRIELYAVDLGCEHSRCRSANTDLYVESHCRFTAIRHESLNVGCYQWQANCGDDCDVHRRSA